jgi:diketogulonate reductase-like aldo/keto reductase
LREFNQLWNNSHRPENVAKDLELTLKQLGTTYLDLYLIVSDVVYIFTAVEDHADLVRPARAVALASTFPTGRETVSYHSGW